MTINNYQPERNRRLDERAQKIELMATSRMALLRRSVKNAEKNPTMQTSFSNIDILSPEVAIEAIAQPDKNPEPAKMTEFYNANAQPVAPQLTEKELAITDANQNLTNVLNESKNDGSMADRLREFNA